MHKIAFLALLLALTASLGANLWISQHQALVAGALQDLKFESQPDDSGLVGAPTKLKVTQKTLEHLKKLLKDDATLTVDAEGTVTLGK